MKHLVKIFVLLSLFSIIYSCKEKEEVEDEVNLVDLTGNIINTTDRPVGNAIVELFIDGSSEASYTTTSSSTGGYEFLQIDEGNYTISVNNQGYNETSINTNIVNNSNEDVVILGSANVSGLIIDSQTGGGLSNATVSFTVNQSATSGENAELQVNTDSSGNFIINNGPTGDFIGFVEATGFFVRNIETTNFTEGANSFDPITCVKEPEEGTVRVVLSWGENPSDLDSHLTGPRGDGSRFHVYFSNPGESGASLDVDDVSSYGPETITISTFYNGIYRYSIHNYSNSSSDGGLQIEQSPTQVEVYDFNGLVASYTAPAFTGNGNTWRVFEINVSGSTASINSVNTYVQASSSSDVGTFKQSNDKSNVIFDISSF